jgi:D-alanyl-D-alanine carboxypeptidase/D-alanyl-D-alanine-endopeptidase (penicillin-binding protein 4)
VAQVSGLNYNTNCLDVRLRPGSQVNAPALVSITPDTHYVRLINRTKTVAAGNSTGWASRSRDDNEIVLRGNVRTEQLFNVTIDRPAAFFGMALAEYLSKQGIAIRGKLVVMSLRDAQGGLPDAMEPLLVHQTPLEAVVRRANQRSLNLAAECLIKRIGADRARQQQALARGTWQNGSESAAEFIKSLGYAQTEYLIDDGSGLSRNNRLSAGVLVGVLRDVYQNVFFERFLNTLAKPGAGTLQRRFGHFDSDRLYAKTGFVNGAWALSGFYQRSDGQWVIFSMIANRKTGGSLRPVIDAIVTAFSKLDEP